MAKGQLRGNKEAKKPKQDKKPTGTEAASALMGTKPVTMPSARKGK